MYASQTKSLCAGGAPGTDETRVQNSAQPDAITATLATSLSSSTTDSIVTSTNLATLANKPSVDMAASDENNKPSSSSSSTTNANTPITALTSTSTSVTQGFSQSTSSSSYASLPGGNPVDGSSEVGNIHSLSTVSMGTSDTDQDEVEMTRLQSTIETRGIQSDLLDTVEITNSTNNNNQQTTTTRFKWTKEKSQVAMNLVKHGCKPKLVSVAVGCSLRTAQKFVETVAPKQGDPGTFREHEIRRRGRKSKDVNQRLEAIREALAKDSTKTQVEIAADLKVSNTTVCRDIKKLGGSWREKKEANSQAEGTKRKSRRDKQSSNKSTMNLRV